MDLLRFGVKQIRTGVDEDRSIPPRPPLAAPALGERREHSMWSPDALDRLRLEVRALQESKQVAERKCLRFQHLLEQIPLGCLLTDRGGTILQANAATRSMLGADQLQILGTPLVDWVSEAERPLFVERLAGAAAGRSIQDWTMHVRPRASEAGARPVRAHVEIDDPQEARPQLRWVLQDLSERDRLERRIRDSEQGLWVRVVERTRFLTLENERLRSEIGRLNAQQSAPGAQGKIT